MLSIRLIKAARALLGWSRHRLAEVSGVSETDIARLEQAVSAGDFEPANVALLRQALDRAGIDFIDDDRPGVRLKGPPAGVLTPEELTSANDV